MESSSGREIDTCSLTDVFNCYDRAVKELEETAKSKGIVTAKQIISILTARDAIDLALSDKSKIYAESEYLIEISKLDNTLRKHSALISNFEGFTDLRSLVNPPEGAWWWFLDTSRKDFWDRFDWIWGALTLPWLAVNLGLIADISSRFLTSTPESISTFTIVFQSILAVLVTGGTLTKTGQDLINGFFENLSIPRKFWHEVKLVSAIALSIILIGFRHSLPSVSVIYNNRGLANFENGRFDNAKRDLLLAIRLNPNFMAAHYNLGLLYGKLQDSENQLTQHKIAAELGSALAHNEVGRIYILNEDYTLAVYFLLRGEELIKSNRNIRARFDRSESTRYLILKNLGWARLMQGRYSEAYDYLEEAIKIDSTKPDAHCLIAQVLKEIKPVQKERTKDSWSKCIELSSPYLDEKIELDQWVGLAKKELGSQSSLESNETK